MKPSERFQAYVIGAFAILLTSLAFLPSSLLRWAGDSGDPGVLRFIGWFALTGLCGAATAEIRQWADRRRNKWLLFLAVPPAAVLAYAVWFILRRLWAGLWADLKQIRHPDWFILVLYLLMLYLWMRGSKYKEQAEKCKIQLENACEALNKQQQLAQQIREAQAGPHVPDEMKGLAMLRILRDPALLQRFKASDPRGQEAIATEVRDQILKDQQSAQRPNGLAQAPATAPASTQPLSGPGPAEEPAGTPRELVPSRCPHCGGRL